LIFWQKFWLLTKIFIFDQNFYFWPKFRFLTKIFISDQNFDFWPNILFLTKFSIFDQHFYFWPKFRFLTRKILQQPYKFTNYNCILQFCLIFFHKYKMRAYLYLMWYKNGLAFSKDGCVVIYKQNTKSVTLCLDSTPRKKIVDCEHTVYWTLRSSKSQFPLAFYFIFLATFLTRFFDTHLWTREWYQKFEFMTQNLKLKRKSKPYSKPWPFLATEKFLIINRENLSNKFWFLLKFWVLHFHFDQNFDYWLKFWCTTKIFILD